MDRSAVLSFIFSPFEKRHFGKKTKQNTGAAKNSQTKCEGAADKEFWKTCADKETSKSGVHKRGGR